MGRDTERLCMVINGGITDKTDLKRRTEEVNFNAEVFSAYHSCLYVFIFLKDKNSANNH